MHNILSMHVNLRIRAKARKHEVMITGRYTRSTLIQRMLAGVWTHTTRQTMAARRDAQRQS